MADTNPDNGMPEISAEQWAKEVGQLDSISAEKQIYVEIWWQFGYLRASAFRFQVYEQTLQILLQPQSAKGQTDGYITISLPRPEVEHFEKHMSASGDIVLTMKNEILPRPHDPGVIAWTEVYLATNQDMLQLVSTGAKKQ